MEFLLFGGVRDFALLDNFFQILEAVSLNLCEVSIMWYLTGKAYF